MLKAMYEIPTRKDVGEVCITPESVRGKEAPQYILLRDTALEAADSLPAAE